MEIVLSRCQWKTVLVLRAEVITKTVLYGFDFSC